MNRQILIQLSLICLPALATTVIAGALSPLFPSLLPMVATSQGALHIAAFGAMASFIVRIGGAGTAALVVNGTPGSTPLLATLAACLSATLVMDLLLWSRVVRRESARSTTTQESARA